MIPSTHPYSHYLSSSSPSHPSDYGSYPSTTCTTITYSPSKTHTDYSSYSSSCPSASSSSASCGYYSSSDSEPKAQTRLHYLNPTIRPILAASVLRRPIEYFESRLIESSSHRVIESSSHRVSFSTSSSSNCLITQSKIAAVQIVNLRFDHLTTRSRLLVKEND